MFHKNAHQRLHKLDVLQSDSLGTTCAFSIVQRLSLTDGVVDPQSLRLCSATIIILKSLSVIPAYRDAVPTCRRVPALPLGLRFKELRRARAR